VLKDTAAVAFRCSTYSIPSRGRASNLARRFLSSDNPRRSVQQVERAKPHSLVKAIAPELVEVMHAVGEAHGLAVEHH
jgi:hypothetical protein